MGVKKGQDNFKIWRTKRSSKTLDMVKRSVKEAEKHKLKFMDEKKMAAWVASRTNKHRTTILRSPIYMAEIGEYFFNQRGIGSVEVSENSNRDLLYTKIKLLELQNKRYEKDNARLKGYIEKHNVSVSDSDCIQLAIENKKLQSDIADIFYVFMFIHERVENMIQIDQVSREIRDLTKRGSARIVASGKRVDAFFNWLEGYEN